MRRYQHIRQFVKRAARRTPFRLAGRGILPPHIERGAAQVTVFERPIGIIGYGRIGREVAERAAGLKCRILAANRSPVADPAPAEAIYPSPRSTACCRCATRS